MVSISGWISLLFLVMSTYLAARIPFLNRIFAGLKQQLRWHHWVALLSVAAMFYHLGQLFWNFSGHIYVLFDLKKTAFLSGWISFACIVLSLPFAFFRRRISYRRWRAIHFATAFALIAALVHTFLIFKQKHSGQWAIFLLIAGLATISLLLAIILPLCPFWGKNYLITKISEVRPNLFLLKLNPRENKLLLKFQYDPGHFIYLKFLNPDFSRIWHPFTIISKPQEPHLELLVKARGRDTDRLKTLLVEVPVRILGPFGTSFWKTDQTQLWISYGVGAAIFLAAIRSFPHSFQKKIRFICCESSEENIFFEEELNQCMQANSNFTWELYIGSGQQFISEFKNRPLDRLSFEKFRICGHPGFQNSIKSMLISHGIPRLKIHLEGLL